ncbi:CIC11C00000005456 [Sungouiella intermedia]|uniref:Protein BCP1 n=1 Tax=Sungouiella intermedia TaxID=45354 RepID=A0A1L0DGB2_9ASCO|nr:CIC11C00000005456 [[Candida] intermedia]
MSKRRIQEEDSDIDVSSTDESDVESQQNEEMEEVVNVDFDYFDLYPTIDFHASKTFLRQLFGDDATQFDVSGLADLILSGNTVGTTIKTDGENSDPFALLSVINLTENYNKPSVKAVVDYVLSKSKSQLEFNTVLSKLLVPAKTTKDQSKQLKVGWIVSERMINMPVEVVPPMYKMLLEEMEKSENAHEKYEFDYFLVVSKIYKLVDANIEEEEDGQKSKKKKAGAAKTEEFDYFHYEDLVLEENAKYHGHYAYTNQQQETDSRRVFTEYGIDPRLSLILLDKKGLQKSIPEMEAKFPPF